MFEILAKIKTRPGMYIGSASVSDLFMFLVGYKTARRELGVELSEEEKDFAEHFHDWVQQRFNVRTNNSWAKIILLFTRDEKDGFDCFYKLLDEFKQRDQSLDENRKRVKRVIQSYPIVNQVAEEVG
jgi:hypothetical protein